MKKLFIVFFALLALVVLADEAVDEEQKLTPE
jgi:hypothetical protein